MSVLKLVCAIFESSVFRAELPHLVGHVGFNLERSKPHTHRNHGSGSTSSSQLNRALQHSTAQALECPRQTKISGEDSTLLHGSPVGRSKLWR
jgi:hypothetical protein